MKHKILGILLCVLNIQILIAQDNYEIQVYSSPSQNKGTTYFELHSNFTFQGTKTIKNGIYPTHNIAHETIDITHGITNNFEIGIYFFNAIGDAGRTNFVGTHIRPRITAPSSWKLPFGLSLSADIGYQKLTYSEDDWSIELSPIIDKNFGKFYISFNPSFDKALRGLNTDEGFSFFPSVKCNYEFFKDIGLGFEYYGSFGPLTNIYQTSEQNNQLFLAIDINVFKDWELNAGYGFGFNQPEDKSIFKVILGREIHWKKKKK